MRDRLIAFVKESLIKHIDKSCLLAENITDDLLANGVIVLPCKVGDTVYVLEYQGEEQCIECECRDYRPYDWGYCEADFDLNPSIGDDNICPRKEVIIVEKKFTLAFWEGYECCFGKTVFLTKEEAEEKLKELGK